MASSSTDYLIIGAGSAGCVLANRLSEDPSVRVTLLEAGGHDRHLFVRMPSAFYLPMGRRRFDWCLRTEPEPHMNNRRLDCPRGRLLGGSSSINGMVYVRGHPEDYARWQALGATGWGYENCLPYFKRAQRAAGLDGETTYQGHDGPLCTSTGPGLSPLYNRFLSAAAQAGYARSEDLNGYQQEAFGPLPMTVANGQRMSSARAYLAPARRRANLQVRTNVTVTRIILEGTKATGAELRCRGQSETLHAERAVLLCAGAIHSPQLLQLSGIGDPERLRALGLPVTHRLPEVGANLMDHLEVYVQQACTAPVSLYSALSLPARALIGARWLLQRSGLGATNHFEAGGFVRSDTSVRYPDIQFHFLPVAMSYDGSAAARDHGYQVHVGPMRSPSRGRVSLRSADPTDAPRIQFNYLSHADDWRTFRAAIRHAREIFSQPAFMPVRGAELSPGSHCQTDAQLDTFVRDHAQSAYHPCGSCRMGSDAQAVVDVQGRVNGLQGLRVVDASVFPDIPNGNLNAPTIMLAERMADLIQGRQLAPEPAPYYLDARWQERQRPHAQTLGPGFESAAAAR